MTQTIRWPLRQLDRIGWKTEGIDRRYRYVQRQRTESSVSAANTDSYLIVTQQVRVITDVKVEARQSEVVSSGTSSSRRVSVKVTEPPKTTKEVTETSTKQAKQRETSQSEITETATKNTSTTSQPSYTAPSTKPRPEAF